MTDGITEATNPQGEEFGEDRLIQLLRENKDLPAVDLQAVLLEAVSSFARQPLQDDATLMIVSLM